MDLYGIYLPSYVLTPIIYVKKLKVLLFMFQSVPLCTLQFAVDF
jgi:hypothetical protein